MSTMVSPLNNIFEKINTLRSQFREKFPLYSIQRMRFVFSVILLLQASRFIYQNDDFHGFNGSFLYVMIIISIPSILKTFARNPSWRPKVEAAAYLFFCFLVDGAVSKSMHIHYYASIALCIAGSVICLCLIMSDKDEYPGGSNTDTDSNAQRTDG
ncbi:putative membrane protein [Azospirillum fermentarium]|uniref:hypothetical protein n=1 Tax=Azospirillum fermentarium TaxID=1233114 RepID=UPI002227B8FF|nr:hypothetical protein [Azospirillum fermentarium]MCW2246410.1 putative membrane protein [Azospirillum fermentarium]